MRQCTVQSGGPGLYAFISGALHEIGAALCRGNASLGLSDWYALTQVPGRARCVASLVPRPRWSEVVRGCLLCGRLG
jgi:hypothetical protein